MSKRKHTIIPGVRLELDRYLPTGLHLGSGRHARSVDLRGKARQMLKSVTAETNQPAPDPHTPRVLRPSTKAEKLWLKGYQAYESDDHDTARQYWTAAVEQDPGLADALLGLHFIDPANDELIDRLVACAERIGECQRRFQAKVFSTYTPLAYTLVELSTPQDAYRAWARNVSYEGRSSDALAALERCQADDPATIAVRARVAFDSDDYALTIRYCQQLLELDRFDADAHLMIGTCMLRQQLHSGAEEELKAAVKLAKSTRAECSARYQLVLAYEAQGKERQARGELERIYAKDMTFSDVADRLAATDEQAESSTLKTETQPKRPKPRTSKPAETKPAKSDPEWEALVRQIMEGEMADDPDIKDNRSRLDDEDGDDPTVA